MGEKKSVRDIAAYLLCLGAAVAGAALFVRYVLGVLLPFLLAWALAFAVRPLAARVGRGTLIPNRILRLAILLLLFALFCLGAWLGGARLIRELQRLATRLTEEGAGNRLLNRLREVIARLPFLGEGAEGYAERFIGESVTSLAGTLPALLGRLLAGVPRAIVAAVITLIAAVYFCLDLERVNRAVLSVLPGAWGERAVRLKNGIFRVAGTYVRAYLILMALTGALLLIGFLIMGVDYALLLAFLVSLVDLFPVLGVGTVLVPWSAWCALTGAPGRAVALLVLWGAALLMRQFAEPRILGGSLGVHPLLTLFAMYGGLRLAGVWGMLLGPALTVPAVTVWRRATARRSAETGAAEADAEKTAPPGGRESARPGGGHL